jgi:hypothetical protein
MSANKIGKAIKESCKDDKIMQDLLMELLDYNLAGRQWYKDEYLSRIEQYAAKMEEKDED